LYCFLLVTSPWRLERRRGRILGEKERQNLGREEDGRREEGAREGRSRQLLGLGGGQGSRALF
jgi:hypothetical protein